MIVTTIDNVDGKEQELLGLVMGNTVRARQEALERMIKEAEKIEAAAVVNMRFTTSETTAAAAEILAYGTAVRFI